MQTEPISKITNEKKDKALDKFFFEKIRLIFDIQNWLVTLLII